jgi:hypothetical protein
VGERFDDAALQTNAASPAQARTAKAAEQRRELARAELIRVQLSTPQGREFVWSMLGRCAIFEHIAGAIEDTYRGLGRRDVGLELWGEVNQHPELFLLMQNEAIARAELEGATRVSARVRRRT